MSTPRERSNRLDSSGEAPGGALALRLGGRGELAHSWQRLGGGQGYATCRQRLYTKLIIRTPASGKTAFGNGLREAHGWSHLDLELNDCLAANGLPAFWSRRIWEMDAAALHAFIRNLVALDQNTGMTWGLPVDGFGLDVQDGDGVTFRRHSPDRLNLYGTTAWGVFAEPAHFFAPGSAPFTVNFHA